MPGCGTGYLPSASAGKGEGESIESLSIPGANSCGRLRISLPGHDLAGMRGHAAHRRGQAGFGTPPGFVVGLVLANGVDQLIPFHLVRIRLVRSGSPREFGADGVVSLVDLATGREIAGGRDGRQALGAVQVAAKLLVTPVDAAAVEEQFRAVGKSVLDGVAVEVLVHVIAAVMAAAGRLGPHRPSVLHPAALVDVVNVEVAKGAAAGPEEAVEAPDLIVQVAHALRFSLRAKRGRGPVHAVAPHGDERADLAGLDPIVEFPAGLGMAAHQPYGHLQVPFLRFLGQGQHLARAGAVDRGRLLHEHVDALSGWHSRKQFQRKPGGVAKIATSPGFRQSMAFWWASKPMKRRSAGTSTRWPHSFVSCPKLLWSRSSKTSAMATSLIGPLWVARALAAAPVPRPPQPIRAT